MAEVDLPLIFTLMFNFSCEVKVGRFFCFKALASPVVLGTAVEAPSGPPPPYLVFWAPQNFWAEVGRELGPPWTFLHLVPLLRLGSRDRPYRHAPCSCRVANLRYALSLGKDFDWV